MMAETAKRNGVDLYGYANGKLHKTIGFIFDNIPDAKYIESKTGYKQNMSDMYGFKMAAFEMYLRSYPNKYPEIQRHMDGLKHPVRNHGLGGNLSLLAGY